MSRLAGKSAPIAGAGTAPDVYDRSGLRAGIVHIGVGNFFRAHQAWYLHRLLAMGLARDWAIVGAGVRPADALMREKLAAQDFETTLIQLDPTGFASETVGSLIDFAPVEEGNGPLIAAMSAPNIRIVSLTITEGGYYRDADGELAATHADIRRDAETPDRPRTAFGAMIAALKARRSRGLPPFTALCCDNIQSNGAVLRQTVLGLARLSDPDLADWIERTVAFPNSVVDCIVPATGPRELEIARRAGVTTAVPVTHENFRQWVIEDRFPAGRPPWEKVGAILAPDARPYENMKLRILNAGHQILANVGELLGVETIADCMGDPDIRGFFDRVQRAEILPHVDPAPGASREEYLATIERRFGNPTLIDTTRRVAFDGSSRHPGFVHPILHDALASDAGIDGLALTEALWARMCGGRREDGSAIEPNDPRWSRLQAAALRAAEDPAAWVDQSDLYGDLGGSGRFRAAFHRAMASLSRNGCRAAIKHYIGGA